MLKVRAMTPDEMKQMLERSDFGHLGCNRDGHPYVVPMHYVFRAPYLYFVTTEGTKTDYITANPEICFQVEDVKDSEHWRSVMVIGPAQRLTNEDDLAQAAHLLAEGNPKLTPVRNETTIGAWHRLNKPATYRVRPIATYGRQTAGDQGEL